MLNSKVLVAEGSCGRKKRRWISYMEAQSQTSRGPDVDRMFAVCRKKLTMWTCKNIEERKKVIEYFKPVVGDNEPKYHYAR